MRGKAELARRAIRERNSRIAFREYLDSLLALRKYRYAHIDYAATLDGLETVVRTLQFRPDADLLNELEGAMRGLPSEQNPAIARLRRSIEAVQEPPQER